MPIPIDSAGIGGLAGGLAGGTVGADTNSGTGAIAGGTVGMNTEPPEITSQRNVFDATFYLEHNPDVAAAGLDPLKHYNTYGWREGRDPSASFDTSFYLESHPDVAAAGMNPLEHFVQYGAAEGRASSPPPGLFSSVSMIGGIAQSESRRGMRQGKKCRRSDVHKQPVRMVKRYQVLLRTAKPV
jgi:hypothetical protein